MDLPRPETPKCYSPCSDHLELSDGTIHECVEGLLEGCVGGASCVAGSCQLPEAPNDEDGDRADSGKKDDAPVPCTQDTDCPDYQGCREGGCFSDCEVDSDCPPRYECRRHVCRVPCDTSDEFLCSTGYQCASDDGRLGACAQKVGPTPSADGEPQEAAPTPKATFELSTNGLNFTNNWTKDSFSITNKADVPLTFVVRRAEHVELRDEGRDVETEQPLFWLNIGEEGEELTREREISVTIGPGESRTVRVEEAANETLLKWEGHLEVSNPRTGAKQVLLSYDTSVDGLWSGEIYYLVNFNEGAEGAMEAFIDNPKDRTRALATDNALLGLWQEFITRESFPLQQWLAVVDSTVDGSWNYALVREACEKDNPGSSVRCYPYLSGAESSSGLANYTDASQDTASIPTGVLKMPFAVTLRQQSANNAQLFSGAVQSGVALQYPGNPPAEVRFGAPTTSCEADGNSCLVPIERFWVQSFVGARGLPVGGESCSPELPAHRTPWLLEGLVQGTVPVEENSALLGDRERVECRENRFPLFPSTEAARFRNASFSGANPVPDRQRRQRELELIDGRLINQDTMFMIVREQFTANMDGANEETISGYAMVLLSRKAADLDPDDFKPGEVPEDPKVAPPSLVEGGQVYCEGLDDSVSEADAKDYIRFLVNGYEEDSSLVPISSTWTPNYLCHDTGHFNGWTDAGDPERCPEESVVTYFLYRRGSLKGHSCQGDRCQAGLCDKEAGERGACTEVLADLVENHANEVVLNPVWHCNEAGQPDPTVFDCESDRQRLLAGKTFFMPPRSTGQPVMQPLRNAMLEAFQYRTRFRSESSTQIGFVPEVCQLGGERRPFCYDPEKVEDVRDRIDCMTRLYRAFPSVRSTTFGGQGSGDDLADLLRVSFAANSDLANKTALDDGFERMYAELLLMLGDDAYAKALGSRFDIAETATGSFLGDKLEPNGISLGGGVGYEMRLLYQARQAYELILDRFYHQSGVLWEDIAQAGATSPKVITSATLHNYVRRVVLASRRKARVTSQIAQRYQAFDRADLARHVIERDFPRAYMESVLLSELLREYLKVARRSERTQLLKQMEDTQNLYTIALERMRETYKDLSDEITYFGHPPDYIPFPSPRRFDVVSPQVMIDRAVETNTVAKERDARAIASRIEGNLAPEQFQNELYEIQLRYENQLAEVCGTFEVEVRDGSGEKVHYPAIEKYKAQDPNLVRLPFEPCGFMGNGQLHESRGEVEVAMSDVRLAVQEMRDILERVAIEKKRVDEECNSRVNIALLSYEAGGRVLTLENEQRAAEFLISETERELAFLDRGIRVASATAQALSGVSQGFLACQPQDAGLVAFANPPACAAAVGAGLAFEVATDLEVAGAIAQAGANETVAENQALIHENAETISNIQRTAAAQAELAQCEICPAWVHLDELPVDSDGNLQECPTPAQPGPIRIESTARVETLMVDMVRAQLNAVRARLNLRLAQGRMASTGHRAKRLIAQARESEQLLLNITAAQNDPNVRTLRNADVIDADRTFRLALIDAYRATRVVEYYSAQSYGPRAELFYARQAARGEFNLEDYLIELQHALHEFDNTYGRPSKRVHVVSLRDDILRIPRMDENGRPLSESERTALLREELKNPNRLDARGYLAFPFAVGSNAPSPLTAVHKLDHVEAEISGSAVGDRYGRVYLTMGGTAALRDLENEMSFMRLPKVTAVVNTFFNGVKPPFIDPEIFNDLRLRERPLFNSAWELGLNLRDEEVNKDIDVGQLTDIRLYIYYEDFTLLD